MPHFSAIGLFCEDIREEKSGQDTIIGVMPDNMNVPTVPGALPKLALYLRILFDPAYDLGQINVKLVLPDNKEMPLGSWDKAVVEKAITDSQTNNIPIVGLIFKAILAPFPVAAAGKFLAVVTANGVEYVSAVLNIEVVSATASPPPA
jgi:hypothetical protein